MVLVVGDVVLLCYVFFFKQKTAYEMRISDWSSDVCSSDLVEAKDAKKDALDTYDKTILGAYEADINRFLTSFGASFRLAQCGKNYVGKVPQSTYCLRFDVSDVDVTKTSADDPGFDTTMSAEIGRAHV